MNKFYSTGGLGDAWLVALKLLDYSQVVWYHYTSHEAHIAPILQLQQLYPNLFIYKTKQLNKKQFDNQIQELRQKYSDIQRINTRAPEIKNPLPNLQFLLNHEYRDPYIVIQPIAGRLTDASLRYLDNQALNDLANNLKSDYPIVLLGAYCDYKHNRCTNLCGHTTIDDVVNIIGQSKLFIGYHGILAYIAMSFGIPTIILFDIPTLPGHYMNKAWEKNTTKLFVPKLFQQPTIITNAQPIIVAANKRII